ncbi:hypothetical protein TRFO_14428 [Tritrichomonas foetus]|uniref:Tetratricopeptide repeat protein n=1 Tax=Tritrichomonas foetus TaxID=1144522 RepID=A0A1J4KZR3_9EUKA|nr:hypothetical protein TRFO_14428 [Tritrichomonas foetus]|eukprot:OHT15085.1 hypothetical protein TRFO_14428 [Tritrichomonas foetus]
MNHNPIHQFEKDRDLFHKNMIKRISDNKTLSEAFREIFNILFNYFDQNQINEALQAFHILIDPVHLFGFVSSKQDKDLFLTTENPFPPFDLFVICALLSLEGSEVDVQNRFYCLFEFHRNLLQILKSGKYETVWLNDLFEPQQKSVDEAISIENSRVIYLSELLVILYHSMPPNQLTPNFIDSFFIRGDEIETNDEFCSVIGRILLSNGEVDKAEEFFDKVNDDVFRKMNDAFKKFYQCNYAEAEKCFKEINDPIANVNRAAALVFLGKIEDAKNILKKAIEQEKSLRLIKSVNENLAFLKELTGEPSAVESDSNYNFPINSLSVRIPH